MLHYPIIPLIQPDVVRRRAGVAVIVDAGLQNKFKGHQWISFSCQTVGNPISPLTKYRQMDCDATFPPS